MIDRNVTSLLYDKDFIQYNEETYCVKTNIKGRYFVLKFYKDNACTVSIGNVFHSAEIWDSQEIDFSLADFLELYRVICKKDLKLKNKDLLSNGKTNI